MTADEFGHFKHSHLVFAVEDEFEGGIRIDIAFVFGVLKTICFDVVPKFFGDFATGNGRRADDGSEGFIGLNWPEESWVCFAG